MWRLIWMPRAGLPGSGPLTLAFTALPRRGNTSRFRLELPAAREALETARGLTAGATRMEEEKVVEVACLEAS